MKRSFMICAMLAVGCAQAPAAPLEQFTDANGCRIERVTDAGADDGHFQFHGPSRGDRLMVVGTYRGETKGAYLLDLRSGARTPLSGMTNAGAISPDGASALIATDTADAKTEIVEIDFRTGKTRVIASDPGPEFLASYSPDGARILFNSYRTGKSDIYLFDRATGEIERLTDFDGYDAHADFSPDMKEIVFHRNVGAGDYDIYALDFASGAETPLIEEPGEQAYPAWSPDGSTIVFAAEGAAGPGKTDLYVANADGGNIRRLTALSSYVAYPAWSRDGGHIYFNYERKGKRDVYRLRHRGGRCAN